MSNNPPKHWTLTLTEFLDNAVTEISIDDLDDIASDGWDDEPTVPFAIALFV